MKKIFTIAAMVVTTLAFAQDNTTGQVDSSKKSGTISVRGMYSEPSQFGLSYEMPSFLSKGGSTVNVVNVSYGTMNYEIDGTDFDVDGQGFAIELGSKSFYNKANKYEGFYTANYLSYGNIKFDKDGFDGTYSYFSFFSPEVGYKIQLGDFSIDPFIGITWKIEVKGKGDIDNKNVEEWTPRAGIKIGYSF